MAHLEIESDQEQAQGKHFPDVLPLGECARHEEQLTPPGISSDTLRNLPNIITCWTAGVSPQAPAVG